MENGKVVVTSPVSLEEPSSVLSLLSDLTPGFLQLRNQFTALYRVILSKLVSVQLSQSASAHYHLYSSPSYEIPEE